jgi:16S rRNA (cytosine967-C5)-methyltransferase
MTPSEARLRAVPWHALHGLGPELEPPLSAVLSGHAAERVLDRFLRDHRGLSSEGRAAVAEAVFGVALWRRRLAWHASASPPGTRSEVEAALGSDRRVLLAALLRDLGGAPRAEEIAGLAPGTLPAARPAPAELALRFSLPDWLAATLVREVGVEAEALADALNAPGPICLRPNRLRTTPAALAAQLAAEGVATRPGKLVPSALVVTSARPNVYGLASHRAGLFEVQDEGSQLVAELLDARPGEAVLDLCAGAGGKALHLAAAVGVTGKVHATDVDTERLRRLYRRARRAGASAIVCIHGEAPPAGLVVDRALVDAPCSELGALRRGPDSRFRIDPGSFQRLQGLQLELLQRAASCVRPGGTLVYATCTVRREEDEDVAFAFEQTGQPFIRQVPRLPRGGPAAPVAVRRPDAGGPGDRWTDLDGLLTTAGFVRTWPHRQGCDGFFAAAWTRTRLG